MNEYKGPDVTVEVLISRVVDGVASAADWARLKALAETDGSIWRDLAEAQEMQSDLTTLVARAGAIADGIGAPVEEAMVSGLTNRFRLVGAWGGWAVAAAVGLAFVAGRPGMMGTQPGNQAGVLPSLSASDAFEQYLQKGTAEGRVVGEMPTRVMLEARPAEGGGATRGYEVIYLRQIMERVVVPDLYQFGGKDEAGNPVPVRVELMPAGGTGKM
ncbi:MAG: hypothetical protein ACKVW3_01515 [Phycisphaerales bacterium]